MAIRLLPRDWRPIISGKNQAIWSIGFVAGSSPKNGLKSTARRDRRGVRGVGCGFRCFGCELFPCRPQAERGMGYEEYFFTVNDVPAIVQDGRVVALHGTSEIGIAESYAFCFLTAKHD